jgi:hypothetical protein
LDSPHDVMASGAPSACYAKVPEDDPMYRTGVRWVVNYGSIGSLRAGVHTVTEHEDGKITVSPSLIMPALGDGMRWHGWLRHGVFCDGCWEHAS